ncbi:zinc finger DHHC domain-containing protein, putative [Eimeria necatrix]|uniref:Zinc finger DHHC domain-containing protein, putative n=1 Tax=Eimeria necatrix TaxID=51315 RepID=U6MMP3_9EIME|nr:zinc finger DHHC domain-containing protein, putative [Eimeria necatrix]CDJ62925.1 zinc finger DHHC domain-containing protein, putative [Eimeria necatrix]
MRLVLHPGGIVACLFVWACLFVVKAATNVLFFNILFSDVSAVDGAASGREPFKGQPPLTFLGKMLKILFECVTWLGLISHLATLLTDPGSTKTAPVHHEDGSPLPMGKQLHRLHEPEIFLPLPSIHGWLFIEQWTSAYPGWLAPVLLGGCLLVDVVFLLVTLDFLAEQWEALETNATLVETYRNTHGQKVQNILQGLCSSWVSRKLENTGQLLSERLDLRVCKMQTTLWEHTVAVFGRQWWFWWLPVPPKIAPNWTAPTYTQESFSLTMIRAAALLAGLAVPASARDWLSSENQALKLPVWPTAVEKVLLSEEPTPDDFTEELQGGAPDMNMLPGFTTLENYPNPMVNSMACRRWGMEVSYVCDPERLSNIRHNSSHRCVDEYVSYPKNGGKLSAGRALEADVIAVGQDELAKYR